MSEKKEQPQFKRFLPKGVFTRKSAISRIEFEKTALRGGRYILPGGGGKIWGKKDIKKMIEEDFPKEKFRRISKRKFEERIRELSIQKFKARTGEEKKKIEQKIRFYRKKFLRGF